MLFQTKELRQLVAPADLQDVLEGLYQTGAVLMFKIYEKTTIIEVAKHIEIGALLQEESKEDLRTKVKTSRKKK